MENNKKIDPAEMPEVDMGAHNPQVDLARNKNLFKKSLYIAGGFVVILLAVCVFQTCSNRKSQKAIQEADQNGSIENYREIADNGRGPAAERARILVASYEYGQGNYEEALSYIEKVRTKSIMIQTLKFVFEGDCLVNLDRYDEAIEAFEEAIKEADGNPLTTPYAMHKLANVYRDQKDYEAEAEILADIQRDYPSYYPNIEAELARANQQAGKKL